MQMLLACAKILSLVCHTPSRDSRREPTQILDSGSCMVSLGKEKNPFIEPGIPDAKPFQNRSVIVGFY
ncbi:MAG: hypothetical protein FWD31_12960 [Planctomycetaceae bacterium]|nr:hypothetical protein [Planctomycetaceae bacterium]